MTVERTFLWIDRWDEHQTVETKRGKKWTPPWIRNYTRLLHNDAYLGLSGHRRAILHGLWLEFASSDRRVIINTSSLSHRLALRITMRDLIALNHAGFVHFVPERTVEMFRNGSGIEERRGEPKAVSVLDHTPSGRDNGTARDLNNDLLRDMP